MKYKESDEIRELVNAAQTIVVLQADNPDVDSLASALALEQILGDMGKSVQLYCGIDLPSYLKYLPGSDRVVRSLPNQFDAAIIVDNSSIALFDQLRQANQQGWLAAKPVVIIDHHATEPTIDFAKVTCIHPGVATGELIYELANDLGWELNQTARELLAMSIMSDSLGLTSEATTARSIHIIAELVDSGVSLAALDNARRASMRREKELIHYKGQLLQRVEFHSNDRVATVTIPWDEIEKYSPLYNPPMLVIDDMRLAKDTDIAICFKTYRDGKITAKIRCNYGKGIADKLAESFGGGGHSYAAGFKLTDKRDFEAVKAETIKKAGELLDEIK